MQRSLWLLIALWGLFLADSALGAAPSSAPLHIDASPLLGAAAPGGEGWLSCSARLQNTGDTLLEGNIELTSELPWSKDHSRNLTRAPFSLPGKSALTLELPTHGFADAPPSLKIRAVATDGRELQAVDLPDLRSADPLLFDISVPSRIGQQLRGAPLAVETRSSHARGPYNAPQLAIGGPQIDAQSGAPILPSRAAGYASVSVLLAKTQDLVALGGAELDALASWVLSGGALALVVNRPEDLHHPTLRALLSADAKACAPAAELKQSAVFVVPPDTGKPPDPTSPGYPGPKTGFMHKMLRPTPDVAAELSGYQGGNLQPTWWGASASYGLGEVHLLAFDVTREPFVSSEWVKLKMLDLVRHALERRITLLLPHAQTALDVKQVDYIRRQIDPNENTRWTIAVSALVLLLYAVLAGPLNFYLAARKGRPLRALLHLPIWSGATLLLVVLLGILGKGVEGRARRLTITEAGAGMSRAAATRFRGLFAASSSELSVSASDHGSVLDIAGDSDDTTRVLTVDREGLRLDRLRSKPWQTVMVREDGFLALGGGISLVKSGAELVVKNRAARDLLGVIVKVPGQNAVYFPKIADGELVVVSKGRPLSSSIGRSSIGVSGRAHSLESGLFADVLDKQVPGLGGAWAALENFAPNPVDWWPEDVPVLLGELEGGEGRTSDSGLKLDVERLLVRVIGYGGVP